MPTIEGLHEARRVSRDEFYTQLDVISEEVKHYREHFRGKTVLCNCDDPRVSQFFHYFSHNFETLKLKRLITTCYKSQAVDLFSQEASARGQWLEYLGDKNGNRIPDPEEIGVHPLQADGDFRSEECVALLREADIVVTNPPFSLFRQYMAQLVAHKKQFLIIGNVNALAYSQIFPLIKEGKVWLGASIHSGDRKFGVPKDYPLEASGCGIDEKGQHFIRVKGVRWFTNLDYAKRYEDLICYEPYTPEKYPKYDAFDAIEVPRVDKIPKDYAGVMGVPLTFLDKWNPAQFEILGKLMNGTGRGYDLGRPIVRGEGKYVRLLIRRK